MSDLRTAAQQALEALTNCNSEHGHRCNRCDSEVDEGGKVVATLRAALAQQDEPVQEPDAYGYASRLAIHIWQKHYKEVSPQWKPLDDLMGVLTQIDNMTSGLTLLAQQAEPVQEPVAWQCREHGDSEWFDCGKESYGINPRRYTYRTLYTAPPPPQRKPLTEEVAGLTAQRDALLEALRAMRVKYGQYACRVCNLADATIKAVEEGK